MNILRHIVNWLMIVIFGFNGYRAIAILWPIDTLLATATAGTYMMIFAFLMHNISKGKWLWSLE